MRVRLREAGFSIIEMSVAMAIFSVLLAMTIYYWQGRMAENALRFGTFQVASDIRVAQEQAKGERYQYTVAFTAGTPTYTITRIDNGYNKTVQLPNGVTTNTVSVVFSAFGKPSAAYTVTVQNTVGTASVSVNATGGTTYQLP